jgi:hypothetical protein
VHWRNPEFNVRLREWQERFQQGVVQSGQDNSALLAMLLPGSINSQAQFEIYQNAYVSRLVEALLSNYPALHQLLGDSDFEQLGKDYLLQHPPTQASIRWFGDAMAEFLAQTAPYSTLPVIAELARFEWALRHTIDAADCDPVTVQTLQAIAPEHWGELQFVLHPSITVLPLQWNAPQVWRALTDGLAAPPPQQNAAHWIIYRQADLASGWRSLSDVERVALRCLSDGGSFADSCEAVGAVTTDSQDSAATSAGLLRLWVEQGLIALRNVAPHTGA